MEDFDLLGLAGVMLLELMAQLGLASCDKNLVPPCTQVMCLGVFIDTIQLTIVILPDKFNDVTNAVF